MLVAYALILCFPTTSVPNDLGVLQPTVQDARATQQSGASAAAIGRGITAFNPEM
jgi:hypothetical protein